MPVAKFAICFILWIHIWIITISYKLKLGKVYQKCTYESQNEKKIDLIIKVPVCVT